ncbi:DUF3618 domain-containing protein [Tomitella cavernea]|uniref:DUF3618 domain-containing protein n=1 Tax=Tomitella cavernea TaxID=1387982 RepID=A0ABP9CLY2_9ACTN|nr:DUF3618 domain-containing protein [Tomitella cavernea]
MSASKHSASQKDLSAATPDARDEIEADIRKTRAELGSTVDELARKLDVRAQAEHAAVAARMRAVQTARLATAKLEEPAMRRLGPPTAGVALLIGFLLTVRRRRARRRAHRRSGVGFS